MNHSNISFMFKQAGLLVIILLCVTPAFSQKNGKSGTLQLTRRDGSIQEISISSGITIRKVSCDSLLLNKEWYVNIGKIIPNSCDSITTSVIALYNPHYSEKLELTVYPNPSHGQVRIVINSLVTDIITIQVFDLLGVIVHQFEPFELKGQSMEINWDFKSVNESGLASGMYFIRAATSRGTVTRSIEYFH